MFIIFNQASLHLPNSRCLLIWYQILSLLLSPGNGYEKLNYIHRWSGRCLILGGFVYGSVIIIFVPIIGQRKEFSGVPCLGSLDVIFLGSLKPIRKLLSDILRRPVSVLPYGTRPTLDLLSFRFPWSR